MINKVLLVVPPVTISDQILRRAENPLGVLYIATVLQEAGYEVDVFDMPTENYELVVKQDGNNTYGGGGAELIERIRQFQPQMVGISFMFYTGESSVISLCKGIKEYDPSIQVLLGGLSAGLSWKACLDSGYVDYVCLGEGEYRIRTLLEALNHQRAIAHLDGICYVNKDGGYVYNAAVERIADLNCLPLPDRRLIPMEKYFQIGMPHAHFTRSRRLASMITSRGCTQRCTFCSMRRFWGQNHKSRSVDNIISEVRQLVDRYGVEEIMFVDANFLGKPPLIKQMLRELEQFHIHWNEPSGLFVNALDDEMLELMAASGAYQLTLAVESASERVLRQLMHKPVRLERVKHVVEKAHSLDLGIHAYLVVGYPGETYDEIMRTLEYPYQMGFDSVSIFIATPFPGTDLYDLCKDKGYLNFEKYSDLQFENNNIRIPDTSPDYPGIEPGKLEELVARTAAEYNAYGAKLYPERTKRKYENFLQTHPELSNIVPDFT